MLKTFINYYGGKWRAAPKYPKPIYPKIIEPFAGGAGYSLRYNEKEVILYEKYDKLVTMWKWLIGAIPQDILDLPVIGEFESVDGLDVAEGAKILIGFCVNAANSSPCKVAAKWARTKPNGGEFWTKNRRNRLAKQVNEIKHWKCEKIGSYEEIPDEEATWFIDPPYQEKGKHYVHNSSEIVFKDLAEWCKSRSGQVIVCEQEGATWLPWTNKIELRSAPARYRPTVSKEVYWTNIKEPTLFEAKHGI